MVLDRLVGPYRPPELLPVDDVGHGHVQQPLGHAHGLCGCSPGPAVQPLFEHRRIIGEEGVVRRGPLHPGEAAGSVHALLPRAGHLLGRHGVQGTVDPQQREVGPAGGQHQVVDRRACREDDIAGGGTAQPGVPQRRRSVVPEERQGDGDVLGHRLGTGGPAEFLQQQDQVDLVHSQAFVGLRCRHAQHAGSAKGLPEAAHPGVGILPGGADGLRRAVGREDVAQGPGEEPLVLGEGEVHRASPPSLPRQAQDPLGDDVALDLVGACVDRARQGEQVAGHPRPCVDGIRCRSDELAPVAE